MISIRHKADFEAFFRLHYQALCHYAQSYTKDPDEAEEIVQQCFIRLWEKRKSVDPEVSLKAYVYKMVRNAALNHLSHLEVKRKYEAYLRVEGQDEDKDEDQEEYLRSRIQKAIANMPVKRKEIFLMSRYEGLKYQEIAEDLNISVKTVENHMGAALKQLREELKDLKGYYFVLFFIEGLGEVLFSIVV